MAFAARFRDLMKKYGKVALGVHFSVSAASIAGLYVAVKNNVDVESLFRSVGLSSSSSSSDPPNPSDPAVVVLDDLPPPERGSKTKEVTATSGGALAVAILLNKALFPVRVPVTIALTPPISRFLARRKLIKSHGIH